MNFTNSFIYKSVWLSKNSHVSNQIYDISDDFNTNLHSKSDQKYSLITVLHVTLVL